MPSQQHVCNGLARPASCADESMLALDGQRDNRPDTGENNASAAGCCAAEA